MTNHYNIEISKKAIKELKKIQKKDQTSIINKIQSLKTPPLINIKKIVGSNNCYRLRSGNFRLLFFLKNNTIFITNVVHRKKAYK